MIHQLKIESYFFSKIVDGTKTNVIILLLMIMG